jgi:hypothetical protein
MTTKTKPKTYHENINLSSIRQLIGQLPPRKPDGTKDALNELIYTRLDVGIDLAEQIDALQNEPDVMKSKLAIDGEILRLGSGLRAFIKDSRHAVQVALAEESASIMADAVKKSGLTPDAHELETRVAVRAMSEKQQLAFLTAAVESNNGGAMAAVLNVPAYLTGITQDVIERYRREFLAQTTEHGEQEQLKHIQDAMNIIFGNFERIAEHATHGRVAQ